jgi:isocitrate/isopropylmalate dehydrogenase
MKKYNIAVIPGDGTGPEVVREGVKVLEVVAKKCGFKCNWTNYDFGGERFLKTGEVLPESAVGEMRKADAILLGAIGHPDVKPGILEKGILLRLRFDLDQYINLRPVKLYPGVECPLKDKGPEHIDYVVVRENSGDAYTGTGGVTMKGTPLTGTTEVALTLLVTAPISISANATQAILGVARRQRSKVEAQKYSTAISKKMIQKISMSMPCAVSTW